MKITFDNDHVMMIDEVFSENFCKEVISRYEAYPDKRISFSAANSKGTRTYREGLSINVTGKPEFNDIDNKFFEGIQAAAKIYMDRYGIHTETIDNGYTVAGMEAGEITHLHLDSIHGRSVFRLITMITYLNEPAEGGETYFPAQNIKVKPKTGRIALFPPFFTHKHCSTAASEKRYIMLTWICSNPNLYNPAEGL